MYATDGHTDGRTKATLIAPFPMGAGHNKKGGIFGPHFTTVVGRMQRRSDHMTARVV